MTNILCQGYIGPDEFKDVQWVVGIIMALDNIAALFIMPIFGNLSDKTKTKIGKRMPYILVGSIVTAIVMPFIPFFFNEGMAAAIAGVTGFTIGMIAMMVLIIVFMMSYRSPAVALMPDLTPKPLRSDGRWVRVNEDGFIAFLFEGQASLGACVVEFRALTDDDWAGTDDHDTVQIFSRS